MNDQNNSRFAELTMELLGAKAAVEAVTQILNDANPEVREQLSDAVIKQLVREIENPESGIFQRVVKVELERLAREAARKIFAERADDMAAKVEEGVNNAVERWFTQLLPSAASVAAKQVARAVTEALYTLRP